MGESSDDRAESLGEPAQLAGLERGTELSNHVLGSGLAVRRGQVGELPRVTVGFHLDGDFDVCRIPPDVGTVLVEHRDLVTEHVGLAAGEVPLVGPASRDPQRVLLPGATDDKRWPRLLDGLRLAARSDELVKGAVEVGDLLGEQRVEDRTGFLEPVEAFLPRRKADAVGPVLVLDPAGSPGSVSPLR
jgi:hypothetical protein